MTADRHVSGSAHRDVVNPGSPANRDPENWRELSRPALLDPLMASPSQLKGVGPKLHSLLKRLFDNERVRVLDLLLLRPRYYLACKSIDHENPPAAGDWIEIDFLPAADQPNRARRGPTRIVGSSNGLRVDLVFFKIPAPALLQRFKPDHRVRLQGKAGYFQDQLQLVHPKIVDDSQAFLDASEREQPVYPAVIGLSQPAIASAVAQATQQLPALNEWLDPNILAGHSLPSFAVAVARMHALAVTHRSVDQTAPPMDQDQRIDQDQRTGARRRLALDELTALQIALSLSRANQISVAGRATPPSTQLRARLQDHLTFEPTAAQTRVITEIDQDMAASAPMTRLLQGDVGSGKTFVALAAILSAVEAGRQAALMVPTELLARQHHQSIRSMLEGTGIEPTLLIGAMGKKARDQAKTAIAGGAATIVIGTHALFQEQVLFRDLALVVVDEQHRFGVDQRMRLRDKGSAPDLLLLTATPIPRSLILMLYGDIDVSKLDQKPAQRKPVSTKAMPIERLEQVIAGVSREIAAGGQVFWLCPLVEPADGDPGEGDPGEGGPISVIERFEQLGSALSAEIDYIHGKQPAEVRDDRMARFAAGQTRLLVATTVIEVGVDVPGATAIVIENAERFGLAQLHQLRGRVGRNDKEAHCLLLYQGPLTANARTRIDLMRRCHDGFVIAEEDLKLRGGGEVLGSRQSGLNRFKFADLADDLDLFETARIEAARIMSVAGDERSQAHHDVATLIHLFDQKQMLGYLQSG